MFSPLPLKCTDVVRRSNTTSRFMIIGTWMMTGTYQCRGPVPSRSLHSAQLQRGTRGPGRDLKKKNLQATSRSEYTWPEASRLRNLPTLDARKLQRFELDAEDIESKDTPECAKVGTTHGFCNAMCVARDLREYILGSAEGPATNTGEEKSSAQARTGGKTTCTCNR